MLQEAIVVQKNNKFYRESLKILNHVNTQFDENLSNIKCHFELRKLYMPRKQSIDDYFHRIIKYLDMEEKIGVMQLVNVYKNEFVDIGIGFFKDKEAIQIISQNVWFRFYDAADKEYLVKPQITHAFKFLLQKYDVHTQDEKTVIPQPRIQIKKQADTPNRNNVEDPAPQIQQGLLIEDSTQKSKSKSRSRSGSKNRGKRRNLEQRLQTVNSNNNNNMLEQDRRVVIYIIGIPKQFGRKQIFKSLKYHKRGQFLLKTWNWKTEDDIPFFEITLADSRMSELLLEDCLDVNGVPVLLLEKLKNRPLRSLLCEYQIKVVCTNRKMIPYVVYKFFRQYGRIVHFYDLTENVCIVTYGRKEVVPNIPKIIGEYRVERIEKHEVFKLFRLSLNNIFYSYIEKQQNNKLMV